ncbi:MAG: aspartate kinase [Bacteroidales bacterium]|nr:aspartate kinase [Bacteroidales bacterium]
MPRIFKFGGALLKDAEGLKKMASLVNEFQCEPLVVVVSAIGKTTNALEELQRIAATKDEKLLQQKYFELKHKHMELIQSLELEKEDDLLLKIGEEFRNLWDDLNLEYTDRYEAYDRIVCFGEKFSAQITYAVLLESSIPIKFIDATKIIVTDNRHTQASVNWPMTEKTIQARVSEALNNHQTVITQGFIGACENGNTTTLGREGSDFTAAILAYVLEAEEVCIWKDVPGLMNCDPRQFTDAVKLPHVSYNEAIELAFYGASVIHPRTIQPLKKKGILLKVCSFYEPSSEPTFINSDESDDSSIPKIIVKKEQTLLSISSRDLSFMAEEKLTKVFEVLSRNRIHINLMQNSAVSFSVIFDAQVQKRNQVIEELKEHFVLKYNTGLELLTIRHYNDEVIEKLSEGKRIFLTQKTRSTIQLLMGSE